MAASAAAAAAAATPVAPTEGTVIAIHSLEEWSIQIEEANSAKKLVCFSVLVLATYLVLKGYGAHVREIWRDQSMPTLILESAG